MSEVAASIASIAVWASALGLIAVAFNLQAGRHATHGLGLVAAYPLFGALQALLVRILDAAGVLLRPAVWIGQLAVVAALVLLAVWIRRHSTGLPTCRPSPAVALASGEYRFLVLDVEQGRGIDRWRVHPEIRRRVEAFLDRTPHRVLHDSTIRRVLELHGPRLDR